MMNKADAGEAILELVQHIIDSEQLVIVEGKKDKKALEELGIRKIMTLDTQHKLAEKIEAKEVVLLVDLDREGKKIYRKFKDIFSRRGVRVNDQLRHYLFRNTKLRQVEGLLTYINHSTKTI